MISCTTAVVLAAGVGSRMRRDNGGASLTPEQAAAASLGIKGMIPDSRGRPFLDHVLGSLVEAGIESVVLVVGTSHDLIRNHYTTTPPHHLTIEFVVQPAPRGTADAVLAVEPVIRDREFLVLNADNLYSRASLDALVALGSPGLVAFDREHLIRNSNIEAERITSFAILTLGPGNALRGIIEKPSLIDLAAAESRWISMNLWRFDREIFAACRDVAPSPRGELELPIAVGLAVDRGAVLQAIPSTEGVLDLSSRADVAHVARQLGDRELRL
jgi:glucose-1-phosphate thymidylyltransferase